MSKNFDLETFTFNGHTLRTVVIDGKPWFIVADILGSLGIQRYKASNYRYHMDMNEWGNVKFHDFDTLPEFQAVIFPRSASGQRTTNLSVTSESGLYKIVLRAQRSNPAAPSRCARRRGRNLHTPAAFTGGFFIFTRRTER